MSDIHFIILFNGTSNDDTDPAVTNIVKMRDGLKKDDTQYVIYRDGIGNDKQWRWYLPRLFAEVTGYGGGWVMHHAYHDLRETITKAVKDGKIKSGDTLHFSVGGFSRGAALARDFANRLLKRVSNELTKSFNLNVNVKLACEYLFDTVASFGIPINLWVLDKLFNIRNQEIDLGWNFKIPDGTKVFHAVACDEQRHAFKPTLVNFKQDETEEVWFDGDHSSVGGGHQPPTKETVMSDENTLRYMVRRASQNGLRFEESFMQKHGIAITTNNPLGMIKTPTYEQLPPTQRGPRQIMVMENDKVSTLTPTVAESVLRRIKDDPSYCPKNIQTLNALTVFKETGEKEMYTPNQNVLLWKSRGAQSGASKPTSPRKTSPVVIAARLKAKV